MAHFRADCPVHLKADQSPVTQADREAEALLLSILERDFPDIPIVAEERCEHAGPPQTADMFFLVDPLDGTREFIEKSPEFTVNIALIRDGYPAAGIVYAPALDMVYFGGPSGAFKQHLITMPDGTPQAGDPVEIRTRLPDAELKALVSRKHSSPETERFLQEAGITERVAIGSSLKFCLLAEGAADVYPRFTRTMQWDTAAGDAVLRAAGGTTVRADDRTALTYAAPTNRASLANPSFISSHGRDQA